MIERHRDSDGDGDRDKGRGRGRGRDDAGVRACVRCHDHGTF